MVRVVLTRVLSPFVAGAAHRTMTAVSAAGRLTLFLVLNERAYDQYDNYRQNDRNKDRSDIFHDPAEHETLPPLRTLLVGED